ncbi:MAG: hypothetical protein LW870_14260 [Pirellula sp.]|nr:hypothetical protein [Pirellula sp.]
MIFPICSVSRIGIVACGYGFTSIGFRLLMEPTNGEDKIAILPLDDGQNGCPSFGLRRREDDA